MNESLKATIYGLIPKVRHSENTPENIVYANNVFTLQSQKLLGNNSKWHRQHPKQNQKGGGGKRFVHSGLLSIKENTLEEPPQTSIMLPCLELWSHAHS